ncbi:MAG TPA: glutathione peroxidase [Saprospiraceae bacterium]|nr:glutathione peroxidase [Saprospiraceae bacterium]MCB9329060.1 glutathione peroxidase [Lewinellaceae bacterium]HPK10891.1 glutathione peroxidase [Saprospiraceae bacterium]HPQ22262.1 glutathione peroxidase [Saprospiraceae bacterium]HRX29086.1 glutathione peroxidase [Saprospiraceae bacterium]
MTDIYGIKINKLDGSPLNFEDYKGKKLLIVNTASECGLTPQLAQLQELHENYGDKIIVIGTPCNDFGNQEPGNSAQIQEFCTLNYGVSFILTEKVKIKIDPHPLYQYLMNESENGIGNFEVEWNFHKFLLDEDGIILKSIAATTSPLSNEILDLI